MHNIQITKLPGCYDLPQRMSEGSSGYDLYAAVNEQTEIFPNGIALIPTGVALAIPKGLEAQVRSRSGLALKKGVFVLNSPGTIDADYRGEIAVILYNISKSVFQIDRGDRIAQLVFQEVPSVCFELVSELESSVRSSGGFGSTGVR